ADLFESLEAVGDERWREHGELADALPGEGRDGLVGEGLDPRGSPEPGLKRDRPALLGPVGVAELEGRRETPSGREALRSVAVAVAVDEPFAAVGAGQAQLWIGAREHVTLGQAVKREQHV